MKSNTLAIILVLGVLVIAANAATSLRSNTLKQQRAEFKHTLEQKNIDQGVAGSQQFVEADLENHIDYS